MLTGENSTLLVKGNLALRNRQYELSIRCYVQALTENPSLGKFIRPNLNLARKKYRACRNHESDLKVAIACWELAHNPAGRAYTLALIYQTFANVEIIGTIFPGFGRDVWEPIRNMDITKRLFIVEDETSFIKQAISLVMNHPYDVVHLSKPRASNIFFAILYKEIWGAKVLIDVDDEELAFVHADSSISLNEYVKEKGRWPSIYNLAGKDWTRISVGLINEFDGVTVSNVALKNRYGGLVIHHARDLKKYCRSPQQRVQSRVNFHIGIEKKVVIFFGTPRVHKGLIEIAEAIASLKRSDIVFVIIGDFSDAELKQRLQEIRGVDCQFISNQPFSLISEVCAIGDLCVLLQKDSFEVSKFQIPAKLSDALAVGIPVLANETASLAEVFAAGAVIPVTSDSLAEVIKNVLDSPTQVEQIRKNGFVYFDNFLDLKKNAIQLRAFVDVSQKSGMSTLLNSFIGMYIWNETITV